jgi:tetratricopeptide (TPR) repeat protein
MLGDSMSQNHRRTADILSSQRDYENARLFYRKSLNINPFNYNSLVKYAEINFHANNPGEAEKYLDKALKLYPDLALANYIKSQIRFKRRHLFESFYYSAVAYYKYQLNSQYKQWLEFIRQNLEKFIANSKSLSFLPKESKDNKR